MPIEDLTVEWKPSDSPFVPVADIHIPAQQFNTPESMASCENMSFNPWHSLAAHKPVGGLNRLRKAVYLAVVRYRREKNETASIHEMATTMPVSQSKSEAETNTEPDNN